MRSAGFFRFAIASVALFGLPAAGLGQSEPQKPAQPAHRQKPAADARRVWTEDNIGSVRSAADNYTEQKDAQATLKDASAKQTVAAEASPAKQVKRDKPPLLSNPKTVTDADKMIAWEDRDIAAQTEYLAQLQNQLAQAPPEDRARLQNVIKEHQQTLAETQAERQGLVDQRKGLEKKPASPNGNASATSN